MEYVSPAAIADGIQYVYITATDALGRQDQAVFRLKIGAPDDGADNGDPHIRTVDGKYYDFQAVGEFTLLRDTEGLEIQVRQTPVPTATPIIDSLQRPDVVREHQHGGRRTDRRAPHLVSTERAGRPRAAVLPRRQTERT